MNQTQDYGDHFQTPTHICEYMAAFVPGINARVLEPTPGKGNLVKTLKERCYVYAPEHFEDVPFDSYFDYIVMNPPFSPMKVGYQILYKCMNMTDNIIALMPYLTIINGEKRTKDIMHYGLKSITHLPRSTFKGSRVQTCILEMHRGYMGDTIFKLMGDK